MRRQDRIMDICSSMWILPTQEGKVSPEALGNLFLCMVLSHPTWKTLFYYLLQQGMCCTTDPHTKWFCWERSKRLLRFHSTADTVMSLREHLRKEEEEGKKIWLALWLGPQEPVMEGSPSWFCPLPSLHLPSWEVRMLQAFAGLIFHHLWWHLLRSRYFACPLPGLGKCWNPFMFMRPLKREACGFTKRGKCQQEHLKGSKGCKVSPAGKPLVWRPHKHRQPRASCTCRVWTKFHYLYSPGPMIGMILCFGKHHIKWLVANLPSNAYLSSGRSWLGKPNEILTLSKNSLWGSWWRVDCFQRGCEIPCLWFSIYQYIRFGKVRAPIWALSSAFVKWRKFSSQNVFLLLLSLLTVSL